MLALALSARLLGAEAQDVKTYLESSGTEQRPRSNAGVSMQGERLRVRADLAVRGKQPEAANQAMQPRPTASTQVVPSLRSAFTIAQNLNLETGVSFGEWNASSATTFDTRLRYRRRLGTFFDEFDGSLWRSPEGATKQSMRLGFQEALGDSGVLAPPTLTGAATFEATQSAAGLATQPGGDYRIRIETRVAGLMPTFLGADHAVGFKVEKRVAARPESTSTLVYNPSWTPSSLTDLRLNLQFLRQTYSPADDFAPSIDFTWRSRF